MTSLIRDNRGYSLIELLVSVLLMSIVLGLSARALSDTMRADDAIGLLADVNQNLQSSSTMMVRDFVDAGRNLALGGVSLPVGPAADVVRPGPATATAAGWPTAGLLYAVTPGNEQGPVINGNTTDVVTIVSVDDRVDMAMSWIAVDANGATVRMVPRTPVNNTLNTNPGNTINVGDLMLVTRGGIRAILHVTSIDPANPLIFRAATAGDTSNFNQQGGTGGSMAQVGSTVLVPVATATPDTDVKRIKMITYWVEERQGLPYLMRQENYRAAVEVGLGVDNLELRYDVLDGANVVTVNDPFVDRPGTSPNQFDKAHILIAVRSDRKFVQTKGYLRNNLTTQVSLRSLQVQQNFM
jgi:prepilin-type N-terminal cleavage/methylation domain-containing protein